MGTFSKSLASLRRLHRRPRTRSIDFLRVQSRAFLFTASAVPAAVGAALAALRILRTDEGRALLAGVLDNARYLRDGLRERGLRGRRARSGRRACTPIVPVLVGDDWKAVLLWRALYDAGVFVNTALHPAVPPGGALLRTCVMATHDRATLDRALDAFAIVKRSFEVDHGPLPGPSGACIGRLMAGLSRTSQEHRENKKVLLADVGSNVTVDRAGPPVLASQRVAGGRRGRVSGRRGSGRSCGRSARRSTDVGPQRHGRRRAREHANTQERAAR